VSEHSPSLRFLTPEQRAELAPSDARRIGVTSGDEVEVTADGRSVRARVALRQGVQPGSVFLVAGTDRDNATALTNGVPRTVEISRIAEGEHVPLSAAAAPGPGAEAPPT
jgi:anaerobic selenocysteine-containing dehydrogenase